MSDSIITYNNNAYGVNNGSFKLTNLSPENIRSGVTVAGVTGTYTGTSPDSVVAPIIQGTATSITSNATKVANYKFYNDTNITSIDLPECTEIGAYAFEHVITNANKNISKIYLPKCKTIKMNAFCGIYSPVQNDIINRCEVFNIEEVETIEANAFAYLFGLMPRVLNIPKCKTIGSSAFAGSISSKAIYSNGSYIYNAIEEINAPLLETIGDYAFDRHTNTSNIYGALTSLNLPECLSIGNYAFRPMRRLVTITLPKCTSIGTGAFYQANQQITLTLGANQVCSLASANAFNAVSSTYPIICYVPSELVEDYKVANYWSTLYNNGKITFQAITES